MRNTIIYLIGFAGTGKYTVAREICKQIDAKLIDNHYINNPIFNLVKTDGKTPLPETVWGKIKLVRKAILETITELSSPKDNFVFTNQLRESDPDDKFIYEAIAQTARRRNSHFIPVRLSCALEENKKRITNQERAKRHKTMHAQHAVNNHTQEALLKINHSNRLDLDITAISPQDAASTILQHARKTLPHPKT